MREYALIVAGGQGTRFGSSMPKQFLELDGKPVLLHTIDAFFRYAATIEMIVVLPESQLGIWNEISARHGVSERLTVVPGGPSRFQSVKKGLENIHGEGLVAIHDGVRPLVSTDTIGASFRYAAIHSSAICSVALKDSLRMVDNVKYHDSGDAWQENTRAVDRSRFRLIQTPQTFTVKLIKAAYNVPEEAFFTDDATVFEQCGHRIFLFEGAHDNIKITTRQDHLVAEALLRGRHM